MKSRTRCILSLLSLITVAIAGIGQIKPIAAQSVPIESKRAQCQRFEAGLTRFNANLTAPENDRNTQRELIETLLTVFNTEIKQLERQTFTDTKIQALHQQALSSITSARNHMMDYLSATERREPGKADRAFGEMQRMPYELSEVIQQFERYCRA